MKSIKLISYNHAHHSTTLLFSNIILIINTIQNFTEIKMLMFLANVVHLNFASDIPQTSKHDAWLFIPIDHLISLVKTPTYQTIRMNSDNELVNYQMRRKLVWVDPVPAPLQQNYEAKYR